MKKVYVVGDYGPEHNEIKSIHKTYVGALKAWNKLRLKLLNRAEYYLKNSDKDDKDMYKRMVKNLSCANPKIIDSYPHETPYVYEMDLKE